MAKYKGFNKMFFPSSYRPFQALFDDSYSISGFRGLIYSRSVLKTLTFRSVLRTLMFRSVLRTLTFRSVLTTLTFRSVLRTMTFNLYSKT